MVPSSAELALDEFDVNFEGNSATASPTLDVGERFDENGELRHWDDDDRGFWKDVLGKGPDVDDIKVYDRYRDVHRANVYEVARDTLGLEPPNMEFDVAISGTRVSLPRSSESGTSSGTSSSSISTDLPNASNVDATGEVVVGSSGMPYAGGTPSTPSTATTTRTERCGGRLRHNGQAGEVLPAFVARDDIDEGVGRSHDSLRLVRRLPVLARPIDGVLPEPVLAVEANPEAMAVGFVSVVAHLVNTGLFSNT